MITAIIVILVTMNYCKKDSQVDPTEGKGYDPVEVSIVSNIHSFLQKSDMLRNGNTLKSSSEISIDSAKSLIGSTINYTYGYPTSGYNKSIWDTLYIDIPINQGSGKVYYDDAISTYNESIDSLVSLYRAIDDTTKKFVGISMKDLGTNGTLHRELLIIAHFGIGENKLSILNQNGLFNTDDEYWYEDNSYKCDETGDLGAPDILESEILFKYLPVPQPGYHVWFEPNNDGKYCPLYNTFSGDGNIDNYCDYKIFYAIASVNPVNEITKCLDYNQNNSGINEMNFYLDGAEHIVNYWLEKLNPNGYSFETCSFTDKSGEINDYYFIQHELNFQFAKKHITPNGIGGGNYPTTLTD